MHVSSDFKTAFLYDLLYNHAVRGLRTLFVNSTVAKWSVVYGCKNNKEPPWEQCNFGVLLCKSIDNTSSRSRDKIALSLWDRLYGVQCVKIFYRVYHHFGYYPLRGLYTTVWCHGREIHRRPYKAPMPAHKWTRLWTRSFWFSGRKEEIESQEVREYPVRGTRKKKNWEYEKYENTL